MQIIRIPREFQDWRNFVITKSLGFVPTMGALHAGHLELLKRAKAENQLVALSIFVNPTQFNDPNDFSKYPKTWESDLEIAKQAGVDVIFAPESQSMYPDQYKYQISENDFSNRLCGASRPGHFNGVLTVVMKLLLLTKPNRAYFGEKDYQQLELIRQMIHAFFLETTLVSVATLRETDGLALSSRNVRLTEAGRQKAPLFYKILKSSPSAEVAASELAKAGFRVDYVTDFNHRRFGAIFLDDVRLIDNVEL